MSGRRPGRPPRLAWIALAAACALGAAAYAASAMGGPGLPPSEEVSLTAAFRLLSEKRVSKVDEHLSDVHPTRVLVLRLADGRERFFRCTSNAQLDGRLADSGADVTLHNDDAASQAMQALSLASSVLVILLFGGFGLNAARRFLSSPAKVVKPGRNATRFSDVAGQAEAKESLREVIDIVLNPAAYEASGAVAPAGVLMTGPPGTGKTLLAKAMAAECGVTFLYVPGSAFVEMYAGLAARRWRSLMKVALRQARGCVIFVDEFELICGRRGASGGDVQSERDQLLAEVLVSMDGIAGRTGVILLAATNRPEALDPAITRPGRIDRIVPVVEPGQADRVALLEVHTRRLRLAAGTDLAAVARMAPGFTGAQMRNLANEAAIEAARDGRAEVTEADFEAARDAMAMGRPRRCWNPDPDELRACCIHEAGHALVATLQPDCDPVQKASVVPRGRSLGQVLQVAGSDRAMHSKRKLLADLTVLMAGRAAEALEYGDDMVSTGAQEDISEATRQARRLVGKFGMDAELGCMDYLGDDQGRGCASPNTLERVDAAVARTIRDAFGEAYRMLSESRAAHAAIASALMERRTINGDEVRSLAGVPGTSA